jgi:N6-adenosine-specific RNA methylase IME4
MLKRPGKKDVKTIVADPPWPGPVGDWRSKPLIVQQLSLDKHKRKAPGNVYPLMSLQDIYAVAPRTADRAHLWLWILPQHIDWGWNCARAWGFEPVHLLAWAKPGFGTGRFQANTEYIILARKGGPVKNPFGRMPGTHFEWPRTAEHSAKPREFYDMVRSVSPGPYLELFARGRRQGWRSWGNEVTQRLVMSPSLLSPTPILDPL